MATQIELQTAYDAARASGDKRAEVAASAALSAWIMEHNPPQLRGRGSRVGRQQSQLREALLQESRRVAAIRAKYR